MSCPYEKGDVEGTVNWESTSTQWREGRGWIGVDLDGTLAKRTTGKLNLMEIGPPIPGMVEKVLKLIDDGADVRIFTARACSEDLDQGTHYRILDAISQWCRKHLGCALPITCTKDWECIEIWDDIARRVESDTGEFAIG